MNKNFVNKEMFKKQYINYVNKSEELTKLGDYKENNKVVRKMLQFVKKNKDENFFADALNELMESNVPYLFMSAVNTSLANNVNVNKALSILETSSKKEELGIYAQIARINLKKYYSKNERIK